MLIKLHCYDDCLGKSLPILIDIDTIHLVETDIADYNRGKIKKNLGLFGSKVYTTHNKDAYRVLESVDFILEQCNKFQNNVNVTKKLLLNG